MATNIDVDTGDLKQTRKRKRHHSEDATTTTTPTAKKQKTQDGDEDDNDIEDKKELTSEQKMKIMERLRIHHERLKKCTTKQTRLAEFDRFRSEKRRDKQKIPEELLTEWEQFYDENLWLSRVNVPATVELVERISANVSLDNPHPLLEPKPRKAKTFRRELKEQIQSLQRKCLLLEQQNAKLCEMLVPFMLPPSSLNASSHRITVKGLDDTSDTIGADSTEKQSTDTWFVV